MKLFKAEMWDKMQYLFRNYYNRMMHTAYFYSGTLDEEVLAKSFMHVLGKVDVLHSTYHNNFIKPYWTLNEDYKVEDFFALIETDTPIEELDKLMGETLSTQGKVQFKARLIRSNGKDILGVIVNHMCFDGTDLRYFNMKVLEAYNKYFESGSFDVEVKNGTRSADQVYSKLPKEDKKIAKSLYKNITEEDSKIAFPFAKRTKEDHCRLIREKLNAEDFLKIKAKGKAQGATINDVLVAAYFRALYKKIDTKGKDITVPCMYDLRRYMGGETYGLTNLIGFMPCTVSADYGKDMDETVLKVKEALKGAKEDKFTGLYSLPLLKLAYTILPHFISEIAIRIGYTNPYIGMSNIGVINPKDYAVNGLTMEDAFMSGAIKYKPYMQLALTTFQNEVTFSIGIRGNDEDEKIFRAFMLDVINELKTYANA
ncbi:MAG: hypothetical protein J6R35_05255 [Clostridia bacterium]|nr:hypothetical protein [Clostridia bacterium]